MTIIKITLVQKNARIGIINGASRVHSVLAKKSKCATRLCGLAALMLTLLAAATSGILAHESRDERSTFDIFVATCTSKFVLDGPPRRLKQAINTLAHQKIGERRPRKRNGKGANASKSKSTRARARAHSLTHSLSLSLSRVFSFSPSLSLSLCPVHSHSRARFFSRHFVPPYFIRLETHTTRRPPDTPRFRTHTIAR